jgi:hypothetical protein
LTPKASNYDVKFITFEPSPFFAEKIGERASTIIWTEAVKSSSINRKDVIAGHESIAKLDSTKQR